MPALLRPVDLYAAVAQRFREYQFSRSQKRQVAEKKGATLSLRLSLTRRFLVLPNLLHSPGVAAAFKIGIEPDFNHAVDQTIRRS